MKRQAIIVVFLSIFFAFVLRQLNFKTPEASRSPANVISESESKTEGGFCFLCEFSKHKELDLSKQILTALPPETSGAQKSEETFQKDGLVFNCSKAEITQLATDMPVYFKELKIDPKLVLVKTSPDGTKLGFGLNTPPEDSSTLDLGKRPELKIKDEVVKLPTKSGKFREVTTVSKKEIALALFQHGRLSEFKDQGCNIQAFKDLLGIRQNTAAWIEKINWGFPGDDDSKWKDKHWDKAVKKGRLNEAIGDVFLDEKAYSMGCQTATKMGMSQGVLDYYSRIRPDAKKLKRVTDSMLSDKSPTKYLMPGEAWKDDFSELDLEELKSPGKILTFKKGVAPNNFIPGDWIYIKNTDGPSSESAGYEGSNAIYMGRNNFDDYYSENKDPEKVKENEKRAARKQRKIDDKLHHYSYEEKLAEVYLWRKGIFTSSDFANKKNGAISKEEFSKIIKTPKQGGILLDLRIEPKVF